MMWEVVQRVSCHCTCLASENLIKVPLFGLMNYSGQGTKGKKRNRERSSVTAR